LKADRGAILHRLRTNIAVIPFWHARAALEDGQAEVIVLVDESHDLPEVAADLFQVGVDCRERFDRMLIDGQIRLFTENPTNEFLDQQDFFIAFFEVPRDQLCRALYLPPSVILQFV